MTSPDPLTNPLYEEEKKGKNITEILNNLPDVSENFFDENIKNTMTEKYG